VVALIKGAVFALHSLLEEAGFEASVPLAELEDREVVASTLTGSSVGGTEGSNPAPSIEESDEIWVYRELAASAASRLHSSPHGKVGEFFSRSCELDHTLQTGGRVGSVGA
jgi:hypothetical protein